MDRIEEKYGITIEKVYSLLSPEEQERTHGTALWSRDPDRCCNLRKVEPLRRKLGELGAWITSIRRDQTSVRSSAHRIEWDAKFGLLKINPIVDWTSKQVWRYIHDHDVPYNTLHDQDYPSIGCTHCTRAVRPGEDPRAGRWSGFAKTECGLHIIEPAEGRKQRIESRENRELTRLAIRLGKKQLEIPPQSRPVSAFGKKRPCSRCTVSSTLDSSTRKEIVRSEGP